jgi:hypothetical protein
MNTGSLENAVDVYFNAPIWPLLLSLGFIIHVGLLSLIPTSAMATFARIRAHVEELQRLSVQLPSALPAVSTAQTMVTRDLRDLLVAYKRVELARNLLPSMAQSGDKTLTDGLARIESALVEMREDAAKEALKQLTDGGMDQ